MKPLARIVLLAATPLALAVSIDILSGTPVGAAKAQDVFVVNAEVPVSGTVAATQSGPWSVSLSGTPVVKISSLPAVNVASLPPVNVANLPESGKQPSAYGGTAFFNDDDTQVVVDMGTVPADRVFVAEFLSARMQLPNSQKVYLTLFIDVQHSFAPTFVGADSGVDIAVLSQPVRFVYTNGSLVRFSATRLNTNAGSGFVTVALSGYSYRP